MAKRTFPPVVNERRNQSKRNDVFAQIEEDLTYKVLYRDNVDGEPNHMENDLDLNGNALIVPSYDVVGLPDFIGENSDLTDLENRVDNLETLALIQQ